jgi:3-oxoacyl-[acyl-carrier-protein] synthase II
MKKVCVTGMGVSTPVGTGLEAFWTSLREGRSGIGPLTLFDASALPVRIGGETKDLAWEELAERFPEARRERDRKVWLGLAAAWEALTDSALLSAEMRRTSLHVGVGLEVFSLEDVAPLAHREDLAGELARRVTEGEQPALQTPLDRLADVLATHYRMEGPTYTNCSACAAGAQAIGQGFRLVREGVCAVTLAGGADSMLNPLGVGGFALLQALSEENDQPEWACRPFEATRKGTVLGEGAGFVVLEELDHARARGAQVYAEVVGYGSSLDAFRVSDPEPTGRGAVLAMRKALDDAGLPADAIDYVNAHGTGTPQNDIVETAALKTVLGERAWEVPVSAIKSMTGHLIGASGAVESIASALTLSRAEIPPTINLRVPDPLCDLDYVPEGRRPFQGDTVMTNSFGFGGQNATLILRRGPF